MPDEPGFKIHEKMYPLVSLPDWRNADYILAFKLTERSVEELFAQDRDWMATQQALVAVAVAHERRDLSHADIVSFIGELKPNEIIEVGLEDDASPSLTGGAGETQPESSPPTSGPSSVSSQEKPPANGSGSPGSPTSIPGFSRE